MKPPKFRFAPSPNGHLHLGHAYSALMNQDLAEALGGSFHLRIEDIDPARSSEAHINAIIRDLHWLGLKWPAPVRRQSDHINLYKKAIERLSQIGLIYPCFATRGEIKRYWQQQGKEPPRDPDGALLYPGLDKQTSKVMETQRKVAGHPFCLRLHMDKALAYVKKSGNVLSYRAFAKNGSISTHQINPERWGDVILARKDIPTSYHLSVVIDDDAEGMTHICRGRDLEAATDIHRLLQVILGLREPLYHHHDLIMIENEKLSKSRSHPSLFDMRARGLKADDIQKAFRKGPAAFSKLVAQTPGE